MSALVRDPQKRWTGKVPFVIGNIGGMGKVWLLVKLKEFNTACDHEVFVARKDEADYIEIVSGANSPIGRQGGKQLCQVSTTNLYHEAGHALGLGHSYFDSRCRFPTLFENVDREAYQGSRGNYVDQGLEPNAASMMAYTPHVFPSSPRIKRVATLAQNARIQLARVRALAVTRQGVAQVGGGAPPIVAPPRLVRRGSGGDPRPRVQAQPQRNPNDINQMTLQEVQQLIADIDLVNEYWTFDDGFMLKVFPTDKAAVRSVIGLP
jgi:hypothetical protein